LIYVFTPREESNGGDELQYFMPTYVISAPNYRAASAEVLCREPVYGIDAYNVRVLDPTCTQVVHTDYPS
jgi:hypothetical protein